MALFDRGRGYMRLSRKNATREPTSRSRMKPRYSIFCRISRTFRSVLFGGKAQTGIGLQPLDEFFSQ